MTDHEPVLVEPSTGLVALLRAAVPSLPGVRRLPGLGPTGEYAGAAYRRPPVRVDRDQVRAYAEVCGFPAKDVAPLTYPHLLAFPLHLAAMSDREFPFRPIGTVHLENSLTAHHALRPGDELEVTVRSAAPRAHAKGQTVEVVSEVGLDGAIAWRSRSIYLFRGAGGEPAEPDQAGALAPPDADRGVDWRLPGDLGRRYAAVSGDLNPIHLHRLTARALGFPRPIAHGMWTKARCVAALENRLPEAASVEVGFKKPVLLPSTVRFASGRDAEGRHVFALTRSGDGAPHLVGRAGPA